jgi:hypothetical protein
VEEENYSYRMNPYLIKQNTGAIKEEPETNLARDDSKETPLKP